MDLKDLKKFMDDSFGTPREGIKMLSDLMSGESGKRIDSLLSRLENLSKSSADFPKIIEILKLILELEKSGALGRIDSILMNARAPESRNLAREMMTEIKDLAKLYSPKLDKLIELADSILKSS
jgi:hypothetical protein